MAKVPNPGSKEAAIAGCGCPVSANNAGNQEPPGGWRVRSSCPVHGDKPDPEAVSPLLLPTPSTQLNPGRLKRFWNRLRGKTIEPAAVVEQPVPADPRVVGVDGAEPTAEDYGEWAERQITLAERQEITEALMPLQMEAMAAQDDETALESTIREMVSEELAKALAERIAPHVKEILDAG